MADLLTKPSSTPDAVDDVGVSPAPDTRWEGRLTGETGTMEDDPGFRLILTLRFDDPHVDGEGRLNGVGEHEGFNAPVLIDGESDGAALEFDLHVSNLAVRDYPFRVVGALDAQRRRFDGKAYIECMEPETCGCEGGVAGIWLQRID